MLGNSSMFVGHSCAKLDGICRAEAVMAATHVHKCAGIIIHHCYGVLYKRDTRQCHSQPTSSGFLTGKTQGLPLSLQAKGSGNQYSPCTCDLCSSWLQLMVLTNLVQSCSLSLHAFDDDQAPAKKDQVLLLLPAL
jgi:hypothetical protein